LTVITYSGAQGAEARGDTRFIGKTVWFSRTEQEGAGGYSAVGLSKLNSMQGTRAQGPVRLRPASVDIARTCRHIRTAECDPKTGQALQSWRLP
jgi:hypothetical protein